MSSRRLLAITRHEKVGEKVGKESVSGRSRGRSVGELGSVRVGGVGRLAAPRPAFPQAVAARSVRTGRGRPQPHQRRARPEVGAQPLIGVAGAAATRKRSERTKVSDAVVELGEGELELADDDVDVVARVVDERAALLATTQIAGGEPSGFSPTLVAVVDVVRPGSTPLGACGWANPRPSTANSVRSRKLPGPTRSSSKVLSASYGARVLSDARTRRPWTGRSVRWSSGERRPQVDPDRPSGDPAEREGPLLRSTPPWEGANIVQLAQADALGCHWRVEHRLVDNRCRRYGRGGFGRH